MCESHLLTLFVFLYFLQILIIKSLSAGTFIYVGLVEVLCEELQVNGELIESERV